MINILSIFGLLLAGLGAGALYLHNSRVPGAHEKRARR